MMKYVMGNKEGIIKDVYHYSSSFRHEEFKGKVENGCGCIQVPIAKEKQ